MTRDADAVLHAPFVTVHVRPDLRADDQAARVEVTREHLDGNGGETSAGPFGTVKVDWPLPSARPTVSIIIPTRDKVELLRACVDSLLADTSYSPFEVLIVDNGSIEDRALAYLARIKADPRVRVFPYPGAYNFSAINNFAVRESTGSYVCFLNNDTEVVHATG